MMAYRNRDLDAGFRAVLDRERQLARRGRQDLDSHARLDGQLIPCRRDRRTTVLSPDDEQRVGTVLVTLHVHRADLEDVLPGNRRAPGYRHDMGPPAVEIRVFRDDVQVME